MASLLLLAVYLAVGAVAYRTRWPQGLYPRTPDVERERLRRLGRRRVLPLPHERRYHR